MRIILSVAAALVCISPAVAAPDFAFRGQWDIALDERPNYVGVVLIDAERRVTWDSPNDHYGQPANFFGYARIVTGTRIEFVITNRTKVSTVDCIVESNDLLRCRTTFFDKTISPIFTLARVGSGPVSLAPRK